MREIAGSYLKSRSLKCLKIRTPTGNLVNLTFFHRTRFPMRLNQVSYVTSHDHLADTLQRLVSRLGSTFVDGGVHPRFGTRNFTLPIQNGQYIEVVCPLDHPATDQTPWGRAVSTKAQEGTRRHKKAQEGTRRHKKAQEGYSRMPWVFCN